MRAQAHPAQTQLRSPHELRGHREASRVPCMTVEEGDALREDIAVRGIQVPLDITADGVVLDGRIRHHAARLADVSPRLVQHAITVRRRDPALYERAKAGQVTLEQAVKQIERKERYAAIGSPSPLPEGSFNLIYADPPWQLGSPT